jgi:hypothetical protein
MDNTSGQGKAASIPGEIRGWSWGAFLMNWIWGLFNRTWIALAVLLPVIGFVVWIILGIKGNEWAWRNKRWDDVEHFKRVQRKWAIAGFVLLLLPLACIGVAVFVLGMGADIFADAPSKASALAKAPAAAAKSPAPVVAKAPAPTAPEPKPAPAAAPTSAATSTSTTAVTAAVAKTDPAPVAAPAAPPATKPAAAPATEHDVSGPKAAQNRAAPATEAAAPRHAARRRVAPGPAAAQAVAAVPASVMVPPDPRPAPRYNDIMSAVIVGDEAGVRESITFGMFVDRRDSNRLTPLMVAALRRELAIARLLLEGGADPQLVGNGARSAMSFARENGDAGMVALLRRYGAPER